MVVDCFMHLINIVCSCRKSRRLWKSSNATLQKHLKVLDLL